MAMMEHPGSRNEKASHRALRRGISILAGAALTTVSSLSLYILTSPPITAGATTGATCSTTTLGTTPPGRLTPAG